MDTTLITLYIPLFYLVSQVAALRAMTGKWETAAIVPVFVMLSAIAIYVGGMLLNLPNPAVMISVAVPASALYLAVLWVSFLYLRSNIKV